MDTFVVELTPASRFHLVKRFVGYPGPFKSQTESKAFRSAFRKLALDRIQQAVERNNGQLSARQAASTEPAAFALTFDEAQVCREVAKSQPNSGAIELALGTLVDDLDAILDGTERSDATAPPLGSEDWSPPKVVDAQPESNG